jgi:hypothetical protein
VTTAKEYITKIESILGVKMHNNAFELSFSFDTEEEGKLLLRRITMMKKEMGIVKKELNNTMKNIRSEYTAKKAEVGTSFGAGLAAGLFGKKFVGKNNAIQKENLRRQQVNAISPYEVVLNLVDKLLIKLDDLKIQIEQKKNQ